MRMVAINERGLRIGEDHQNARLTDAQIDQMRDLHETHGVDYEALAAMFGISKWAVGRICRYERRAQTPVGYRRI